jgi:outer membrane receptor protein involved in Fe transport
VARTGMTGELVPGNPLHKANSWQEYLARDGVWRFDRWSITYDQNMTRATKAHQYADAYRDELGWGEREYTVRIEGQRRVLDIADPAGLRGVEVKTGYVSLSADVAYELKRDALLVAKRDWTIRWHVDGRMSEPLRKVLRAANIQFTETKPTTLIKDL